jgi:hypothetical protein
MNLTMISEILRQDIDRYAAELGAGPLMTRARSGSVDPATVGRYLASVHYMLRHTPIHMRLAQARAEALGHQRLAEYFRGKREEELGHDKWAENDINSVTKLFGTSVSREPSFAVVALMDNNARSIEEEPFLYLAYILFAEYLMVSLGPAWVSALDQRCGVPASALTAATHHIELDQHHVAEGCREIDVLVEDERLHEPLRAMLHQSMRHFSAFCDDLCGAAAAA